MIQAKETRFDGDLVTRFILDRVNTPEEAQELVQYLASLDWHEEFHHRKLGIEADARDAVENYFTIWQKGGGYCDSCREWGFTRLYVWPHLFPEEEIKNAQFVTNYERSWGGLSTNRGRYCWKCFRKEQLLLASFLVERYHEDHPKVAKWLIRWNHEMWQCVDCHRLVPYRALHWIGLRNEVNGKPYCFHCLPQAVERQFILCSVCGKKTTNFQYPDMMTCRDCDVKYPYRTSISTHLKRAIALGLPATLTLKEWIATVEYFKGKCAYCRVRPFRDLEHFLPVSLDGGTTSENCVPACQTCNLKKSNRHPDTLSGFFPSEVLDQIKSYLAGKRQELNIFASSGREIVLWR